MKNIIFKLAVFVVFVGVTIIAMPALAIWLGYLILTFEDTLIVTIAAKALFAVTLFELFYGWFEVRNDVIEFINA